MMVEDAERERGGSAPKGGGAPDLLWRGKLQPSQKQVLCLTPKGDLIVLPRGATPIDFAYAVHTDVGNTCVGCKINGKIMPLVSELSNGDEVEIVCSEVQVPPAAWESVVVTGKARSGIRRATRTAVRRQYSGLGRLILDRAFERAGKVFSEDSLKGGLPRLAHNNVEDMLAAVGRGEVAAADVIRAVYPDFQESRATGRRATPDEGWFGLKRAGSLKFRIPDRTKKKEDVRSIPILGLKGELPVRFAPDGGAVPGDRIVAILTPGEGITIYPIHSPALKEFDNEPDRWLDVRWEVDEHDPERFPTQIHIKAFNEPEVLPQVTQAVAENEGIVTKVSVMESSPDIREMVIDLEVWDLMHLNRIIAQLRARSGVILASRKMESDGELEIQESKRPTAQDQVDAELAAQRPASYTFSVESGRIEAEPQREVPSNADLAATIHAEAIAKAQQILDAHRRSNVPLRANATIARLLEALGVSPGDIVPGTIVSRLRSLEADLKAYDTPEGRAELFPDAIAEMFDLQMTVDDLMALYPSIRELQARQLALALDRQVADVPAIDQNLGKMAEVAAASELVDASAVAALTDVDPEVARLSEIIESPASEETRAEAIKARTDIVAGKVMVGRNFLGAVVRLGTSAGDGVRWVGKQASEIALESLKETKKAIPRGVGKGVEESVAGAIKVGWIALAGALGGPLTALGALVTTFNPFRVRIEGLKKDAEAESPPAVSKTESDDQTDV